MKTETPGPAMDFLLVLILLSVSGLDQTQAGTGTSHREKFLNADVLTTGSQPVVLRWMTEQPEAK